MNQETGRRKNETSEEKVFRKQEALYERLVQLGASVQHLSSNLQRMAEMSARVNAAMLMLVGLPRHFAFGFRSMLFHGAAGSTGPLRMGGNSGFLPRGVSQAAGFGGQPMTDSEYLQKFRERKAKEMDIADKLWEERNAARKQKEKTEAENPNVFLGGKKKKKRNDVAATYMSPEVAEKWINPGERVEIDTETVGTFHDKDSGALIAGLPAEISAEILDAAGKTVEKFNTGIVWPDAEFTQKETKVSGLSYQTDEEGVKRLYRGGKEVPSLPPGEALKQYRAFLGGAEHLPVYGYNPGFDLKVMQNMGREMGSVLPDMKGVNVAKLARKMLPGLEDYSLHTVFQETFKGEEHEAVRQAFKDRAASSGHDAETDRLMSAAVHYELASRISTEKVPPSIDVGKGTQNPPPPKPPAPPSGSDSSPEETPGPFVGPVKRPWVSHSRGDLLKYKKEAREFNVLTRAFGAAGDVFHKGQAVAARFFQEQAKATKSPFWRQIFLAGRTAMFHPAAALGVFAEWAKKAALPTMYAGAAAGSLLSAASPDAYATLTGSVKMLAIAIGQHLIPLAATLSFHFQKWAQSMYEGDNILGNALAKLIGLTAVVGLSVTVLGSLASSVIALTSVVETLGVAGGAAAAALALIAATWFRLESQGDEKVAAEKALAAAWAGNGTPSPSVVKNVKDILEDTTLTKEQREKKLTELSGFHSKNMSAWGVAKRELDEEIAKSPALSTVRQFIGSIPGYFGPNTMTDFGKIGAATTVGKQTHLTKTALMGMTPLQAQASYAGHHAQATSDFMFAFNAARSGKMPSGIREKQLQDNIMKGNQALMAIQTIKGTPQYSSVEEAYKRVQVAALSEDPLTSLLNKWQIELGKLFAEQLAQQKDGNNILANILGAFFK